MIRVTTWIATEKRKTDSQVGIFYFPDLNPNILTKISEQSGQEDDMSGTFEDYLEKSNMLCSQEGVDHYFLPNSQKSDFV